MVKYRQVVWNLPVEMFRRIEKAKAAGQKDLDIPPGASTEGFVLFLLDRALVLYEANLSANKLVIDPADMLAAHKIGDTYIGKRTPR